MVEIPDMTGPMAESSSERESVHRASFLRGRFELRIDEKHRLTVPLPMRPAFADGGAAAVVSETLTLWPESVLRDAIDHLHARADAAELDRAQVRLFLVSLVDLKLDSQGRITVSPQIQAQAGLDRDVSVCGLGPHVEVWAAGRFESAALEQDDSVAESLALGGF